MTGYLKWVQAVLHVVLRERLPDQPLAIPKLAAEVGLPIDGLAESDRNKILLALDHALRDLAPHGLVLYDSGGQTIGYPPGAGRFRIEPLTSTWPELRSGYLESDDEAFLDALANLSEQPDSNPADVQEVDAQEVFAALGWKWDGHRAVAIYGHLKERFLVEGRMYGGPAIFARVTYAGLVRARDDTGSLLREAEDHLRARRLRAAGCMAAVELERRLKQLAGRPPKVSHKRDPSLEDYNQAAFEAQVIDQETWESISTLAVTRKRCVHVLDREPEADEVRLLVDGVERILRKYPLA